MVDERIGDEFIKNNSGNYEFIKNNSGIHNSWNY
jgi:hypothetical protein